MALTRSDCVGVGEVPKNLTGWCETLCSTLLFRATDGSAKSMSSNSLISGASENHAFRWLQMQKARIDFCINLLEKSPRHADRQQIGIVQFADIEHFVLTAYAEASKAELHSSPVYKVVAAVID